MTKTINHATDNMTSLRISGYLAIALLAVAGCQKPKSKDSLPSTNDISPVPTESLVEARKGFQTKLVPQEEEERFPAADPPADLFRRVKYDSPVGKLWAYVSVPKKKDVKLPAIIWIHGGPCNSIGSMWGPADPENDQTAAAYWKSGVVTMYPSLRGGNDNPGKVEGFLGEVEDVLAAADYLAKQEFVDPKRIYLGGHSTGGTMAILVAECSGRFRAVFSFGPVDDIRGYAGYPEFVPFDLASTREVELRSPGFWLHSVKCPLFVFEGTVQGNIDSLMALERNSKNQLVHFYPIRGKSHFSLLSPLNQVIARKILEDGEGDTTKISFSEQDLDHQRKR